MYNQMYGYVQYQADGTGGGGGTSAEEGKQEQPGEEKAPVAKSLDDLLKDETLAGDLSKRITDAVTAAKQQWDTDAAEKERLAQLSAEDRAKEETAKVERDRVAFEHDKQVFAATQQLAAAKLPVEFAKQLVGKDAAETTANITAFSTAFKAAVEAGVTERLKGAPPQAGVKPGEASSADAKYAKNPYYGKNI